MEVSMLDVNYAMARIYQELLPGALLLSNSDENVSHFELSDASFELSDASGDIFLISEGFFSL